MEEVTYQGLTFEPYIRREEIAKQVHRLAQEIKRDYEGKNPLFLCVLNGSFIFAADLFRACSLHDAEIAFIRFKSYEGMVSTGDVKEIMGLNEDIKDRDVLIVEDIIDSGVTAARLRKWCRCCSSPMRSPWGRLRNMWDLKFPASLFWVMALTWMALHAICLTSLS